MIVLWLVLLSITAAQSQQYRLSRNNADLDPILLDMANIAADHRITLNAGTPKAVIRSSAIPAGTYPNRNKDFYSVNGSSQPITVRYTTAQLAITILKFDGSF